MDNVEGKERRGEKRRAILEEQLKSLSTSPQPVEGQRKLIYISSSWKNRTRVRELANSLRAWGYDVYDFTDPACRKTEEIPPEKFPDQFDRDRHIYSEYIQSNPYWRAAVYANREALKQCAAVILLLPCGNDAHADWALAVGMGKPSCVVGESKSGDRTPSHLWADAIMPDDPLSIANWLHSAVGPTDPVEVELERLGASERISKELREGVRRTDDGNLIPAPSVRDPTALESLFQAAVLGKAAAEHRVADLRTRLDVLSACAEKMAEALEPFVKLMQARLLVFGENSINGYWLPVVSGQSGQLSAMLSIEDWKAAAAAFAEYRKLTREKK